jgi:hypothetical protein
MEFSRIWGHVYLERKHGLAWYSGSSFPRISRRHSPRNKEDEGRRQQRWINHATTEHWLKSLPSRTLPYREKKEAGSGVLRLLDVVAIKNSMVGTRFWNLELRISDLVTYIGTRNFLFIYLGCAGHSLQSLTLIGDQPKSIQTYQFFGILHDCCILHDFPTLFSSSTTNIGFYILKLVRRALEQTNQPLGICGRHESRASSAGQRSVGFILERH